MILISPSKIKSFMDEIAFFWRKQSKPETDRLLLLEE